MDANNVSTIVDLRKANIDSIGSEGAASRTVWITAYTYDTWNHPIHGPETTNRQFAEHQKRLFDENARGIEIHTDYDHGFDKARGSEASGWIKAMNVLDDRMEWLVEFTEDAWKGIKEKKWRYFSPSWLKKWQNEQTQQVHENIVIGGGLTNKPIMKGQMPLNFAEVLEEDITISDEVPARPDEREPGTFGTPEYTPEHSPGENPGVKDSPYHVLPREGDPIPGANPTRGEIVEREKLIALLKLDQNADDAAIEGAIKTLQTQAVNNAETRTAQERSFAEQFPEQWQTMRELQQRDFERSLVSFSEIEIKDEQGHVYHLPEGAKESLRGMAVDFAEQKLDLSGLKNSVTEVLKAGLVEMGERGTRTADPRDPKPVTDEQDMVRQFGEQMTELMSDREKPVSPGDAFAKVAKEHPDWASAYRTATLIDHQIVGLPAR